MLVKNRNAQVWSTEHWEWISWQSNVVMHFLFPFLLDTCSFMVKLIWATTWQNQQSDCAPSEDSDQPGHPPRLIRVFAVRGCPGWSESSLGAQSFCWFCHEAAHIIFVLYSCTYSLINTPQPLYNTIIGVEANFRVNYQNRVISEEKV